MHICILTIATLEHQMGGTEVHCALLARGAAALGHTVTIITTRHPRGIEFLESEGVKVHYLLDADAGRMGSHWWSASCAMLARLHRQEAFEVIWSENLCGYGYVLKLRRALRIPIVSIIHGAGVAAHIRNEWSGIMGARGFFDFFAKRLPEALVYYLPWFRAVLRYSHAVIGVSDDSVAELSREFGLARDKIFTVYNSVDTEHFKPDAARRATLRQRLSLAEDTPVLLMSGVLHKQKGMHIGLRAFLRIQQAVPRVRMLIVGEGPHSSYIRQLTARLRLQKEVIFCGLLDNESTVDYYNAADIFLNPTLRREGLPYVILEAMACGKPVVTSRIGGTTSTIDEGISGFFVTPGDVAMLVDKTIEILKDRTLCETMGRHSREAVLEKFSAGKMASAYLDISRGLMQRGLS